MHIQGPLLEIAFVVLASCPVLAQSGPPEVQAILNSASYSSNVAPGTMAVIYGTNFATDAVTAPGVPFPTRLNGVSVTIGGVAAPIYYVSPTQINAVIPFEARVTGYDNNTYVYVDTPAGTSTWFPVVLNRNSPAIFTMNGVPTGPVIGIDAGYRFLAGPPEGPIFVYATGLGPTTPAGSSAGGGVAVEPLNRVQDTVTAYVGDTKATVTFAGLAPGFPGIYQVNITPNGPVSDRVYLTVNGWTSNIATVPLAAGSNVANVTGSIDGLFPLSGANKAAWTGAIESYSVSVMQVLANFKAAFDILPGAKLFSVVAASEAGAAVIEIDPPHGTWKATLPVPPMENRQGRYTNSVMTPIYNFKECFGAGTVVCLPLQVGVLSFAWLDTIAFSVMDKMLQPNGPSYDTATIQGTIPAGGRFVFPPVDCPAFSGCIDQSAFGGSIKIPHLGPLTRAIALHLYVDGKLIASTDAPYTMYTPPN